MSIINNGQVSAVQVYNQFIPDEGPKSIKVNLDFTNTDSFDLDLTNTEQQSIISQIQTLYVDNYDNIVPLTITVDVSGQRIVVNPNTQGYFACLAPVPTVLHFASLGGGKASVLLVNVPMPIASWVKPA